MRDLAYFFLAVSLLLSCSKKGGEPGLNDILPGTWNIVRYVEDANSNNTLDASDNVYPMDNTWDYVQWVFNRDGSGSSTDSMHIIYTVSGSTDTFVYKRTLPLKWQLLHNYTYLKLSITDTTGGSNVTSDYYLHVDSFPNPSMVLKDTSALINGGHTTWRTFVKR